jgi:type VI secretion system protein ImpI
MQEETDPLKLIGVQRPRMTPNGPRAANLANNSPLQEYFRPPLAQAPDVAGLIPDDYDPLRADEPAPTPARGAPRGAPPVERVPTEFMELSGAPAPVIARPSPGARVGARPSGAGSGRVVPPVRSPAVITGPGDPADKFAGAPVNPPAAWPDPPARSLQARTLGDAASVPEPLSGAAGRHEAPVGHSQDLDFAALMAAAGLESARASPELAQQFGQILRVVVTGLMDVLRARERIKDEFRMRMTTFKTNNNNPLKFSANVEDALHNLLVKRNAAYLGPVQAFEDAFQDVRNHQMAMLAGVRVAYEAMLNEFEPGRLQEEFDAHVKGGSFLGGSGKSKYWELYRSKFHDMVKDADTSFRKLFGDEFAKAYEEQLERLKTLNRSDRR